MKTCYALRVDLHVGCIDRAARSDASKTFSGRSGVVIQWGMVVSQNRQLLKNGEENPSTKADSNDTGTKLVVTPKWHEISLCHLYI